MNIKSIILSIFIALCGYQSLAMDKDNEHNNNSSIQRKLKSEYLNERENQGVRSLPQTPHIIPIGSIITFAGSTAPDGWLMCNGQIVSRSKYSKLYEVIGRAYTLSMMNQIPLNKDLFCLPDMRGRVVVGDDNGANRVTSNNTLGASGGEEEHTLTIEQMPLHDHTFPGRDDSSMQEGCPFMHTYPIKTSLYHTSASGGNKPHNNMQPYLVLNYIIKAEENNEINNLNKRIKDPKIQINTQSSLKARFKNSPSSWLPYTVESWNPLKFNLFEGDERLRGNLSTIEIPEDGVYSLFAHYGWKANNKGDASPYTAIAINTPGNHENYFVQHHLHKFYSIRDGINRVTRLKRGDKVMVSIFGHRDAEYYLPDFQFDVEKIN